MTINIQEPLDQDGAQRLAMVILIAAVKDALLGQAESIYWLYSTDAEFWAALAGREFTGQLIRVARRCQPGRRKLNGRANIENIARALSL